MYTDTDWCIQTLTDVYGHLGGRWCMQDLSVSLLTKHLLHQGTIAA